MPQLHSFPSPRLLVTIPSSSQFPNHVCSVSESCSPSFPNHSFRISAHASFRITLSQFPNPRVTLENSSPWMNTGNLWFHCACNFKNLTVWSTHWGSQSSKHIFPFHQRIVGLAMFCHGCSSMTFPWYVMIRSSPGSSVQREIPMDPFLCETSQRGALPISTDHLFRCGCLPVAGQNCRAHITAVVSYNGKGHSVVWVYIGLYRFRLGLYRFFELDMVILDGFLFF